jgi:hypothetical protein
VLIIVVVFILQVKKYSKTKRRFRVGNLNVVDRAILVQDSLNSDDHRLTLKRNGSISIPCSIKAPCIWPKNSLKPTLWPPRRWHIVSDPPWDIVAALEPPTYWPQLGKIDSTDTISALPLLNSDIPLLFLGEEIPFSLVDKPIPISNVALRSACFIARNCDSRSGRENVVKQLSKLISIDSLGECLNNAPWPPELDKSNTIGVINKYMFYLAFENSCAIDYTSEKIYNALAAGSVPIYYGNPRVLKLVPPNSVIQVTDYKSISELANHIKHLIANREEYLKYHAWRQNTTTSLASLYFARTDFRCRACIFIYRMRKKHNKILQRHNQVSPWGKKPFGCEDFHKWREANGIEIVPSAT